MKSLDADIYLRKITDISPDYFEENNINAILIDLDNTIVDPRVDVPSDSIQAWLEELKEKQIQVCFISNRFNKDEEEKLTEILNAKVIVRACKPLKKGFVEAVEHFGIPKETICLIGDQTFTDVLGGNLMGFHTIKVDPLNEEKEDGFLSSFCRSLEKWYLNEKDYKSSVPIKTLQKKLTK